MRVAGLFAGIGGIEMGLARSGHEAALLCEIEPAALAVLEKHFPGVGLHADVRRIRSLPGDVDLLTAGFPCQDLSQAGKTAGIAGLQSGLIGEVFRLLRSRRVPWVLLENVSFMLSLGRGRALEVIIDELERLGYRWAYRVVDTRSFGLPQRRERVFLLAALDDDPRPVLFDEDAGEPESLDDPGGKAYGFYWTEGVRGLGWAKDSVPTLKGGSTIGIPSPPAIAVRRSRKVVTPGIRDAERLQGFEPDWTLPAENVARRSSRWKLIGNAVTVDAAAWIGESLRYERDHDAGWDVELRHGSRWPRAAWGQSGKRFSVARSSWVRARTWITLMDFLEEPGNDLSLRASSGFRARLVNGRLNYEEWFLRLLDGHIDRMSRAESRA